MQNQHKILWVLIFLFLIPFSSSQAQEKSVDKQKLWQELLVYKNINLFEEKKDEERGKADELFNQIIVEGEKIKERKQWQVFSSIRYILEVSTDDKTSYVVMTSPRIMILPGEQVHTIYFFDSNGKLNNQKKLRTGWRMMTGNTELIKNSDFDFSLIKIPTRGGGGFAVFESAIEYYAVLPDKVVLIRLESKKRNSNHNLDNRNIYGCEYPSIGLAVTRNTFEEWKQALFSEKSVDVLDALMWLGGVHSTVEALEDDQRKTEENRKNNPNLDLKSELENCPNALDDAKLFAAMRADKEVQKRISELSQSKIVWIKEAAELALTPIEKRH